MSRHKPLRIGGWFRECASRLSDDQRLLIAVSGGGDSVALLHLLLPPERQRDRIVVATVHHGDEPHGSDSLRFVRRMAKDLGVPFRAVRVAIDPAREKEVGYEAAAREVRYSALERVAQREKCVRLFTAHTRDDQAESVLLALFRGADIGGLAGIRPRLGDWRRPLLSVTRDQLRDFLIRNDIPFLEDPYNDNERFSRVKVRKILKPAILKTFGEGAWNNLAESATRLYEADQALEDAAFRALREVVAGSTPRWIAIESEILRGYVAQVRSRVLLIAWAHAASVDPSTAYLTRRQRSGLDRLALRSGNGGRLSLGPVTVLAAGKRLIFDGITGCDPIPLDLPGRLVLPDGGILRGSLWEVDPGKLPESLPGMDEYLDADALGDTVRVRPWRRGDRYKPLNNGGREVKVVRSLRRSPGERLGPLWIMETASGETAWVLGERIAHPYRLTASSRRAWRLVWTPRDSALPL
ncbi:MAG: tRNA lysidine(34) synthetase TilS [bacterium]